MNRKEETIGKKNERYERIENSEVRRESRDELEKNGQLKVEIKKR